ncbi:hypothetical protein Tdes44962_MAKER05857 [Teratosphaeria destructans]|uniref:WHIM1 domain-containing protein n=1 Tax=Teratosphaeria destructans TaxID=418781 RepID=A0A9W7SJE9_9PEZI|nr:hypothetical protein Tdes44962_MAKER05857 [Teratosphaeria destructans]
MADDSDSSLSSAASEKDLAKLAPIFTKAKLATKKAFPPPHVSPPRPRRPPSPSHEPAFEDNSDIAFIVMFRARFNDAFPPKLPQFGPQNIERGVTDQPPAQQVEDLLCALLGLVLNRKKPVERGHHGRALEEAVLSQKNQWPYSWHGVNPLHGNRDFNVMPPSERLNLLRTLIMWSLTSSEAISAMIKEKYKQVRHNDDENQPLSVQPWGTDGDKRRYFLIEGLNDTSFRVYREGSRYTKNAHWYSVAGGLGELKALATKLQEVDGSQVARRLAAKITNAMPRLEDSEVKRQRREQRQMKMASFARPEPGFGLYEGRTRGKRMRYTYEEDEEQNFDSDAGSTRRSARNLSSRNTPMEAGPTVTLSGRQSRKPRRGEYGELLLDHGSDPATRDDRAAGYHNGNGADGEDEDSEPVRHGRPTRNAGRYVPNGAANPRKRKHIDGYNSIDEMSDEDDDASGDDWDSDRNEADDVDMPDADDESEEDDEEDDGPRSLVVKLKVPLKVMTPPSPAGGTVEIRDNDLEEKQSQHHAVAGAPEAEPGMLNGLTHDAVVTAPLPVLTSAVALPPPPTAASGYPTPASASFPAQDVKPINGSPMESSTQPAPPARFDIHAPCVNAEQAATSTTAG